jgi:predicted RNA-binding Zn-ribbon protein involved in translation (DUF1610 family)
MQDECTANDELAIRMEKAAMVWCVACNAHIAWAKVDFKIFDVRRLIPADKNKPLTGLTCPECGKTFAALRGSTWAIKTDKGYQP